MISLTNVGAVDEAEEIQQRDCGNGVQVKLPSQLSYSYGVEFDERVAISVKLLSVP